MTTSYRSFFQLFISAVKMIKKHAKMFLKSVYGYSRVKKMILTHQSEYYGRALDGAPGPGVWNNTNLHVSPQRSILVL